MPSSLTEVRSFTWGGFPLPTGVGLRYGQNHISLAAFLGGLGRRDFRAPARTRASCHAHGTGLSLGPALQPGSPSCPFDGFAFPTASPLRCVTMRSGAGVSDLLAIAYDYDVLGLGPDSPWVGCRCPGTLRLPVCVVLTRITLLIPAFALLRAPPVLAVWLPCCAQRSPTILLTPAGDGSLTLATPGSSDRIHGFGAMLEPRYVVGARVLDQ